MITIFFWKEIAESIKKLKHAKPQYYRLKEDKSTVALIFTIMIIVTPLSLLFDLFMSPFELLYLIVYKLLWRK